jgi:hypothetical protein
MPQMVVGQMSHHANVMALYMLQSITDVISNMSSYTHGTKVNLIGGGMYVRCSSSLTFHWSHSITLCYKWHKQNIFRYKGKYIMSKLLKVGRGHANCLRKLVISLTTCPKWHLEKCHIELILWSALILFSVIGGINRTYSDISDII